ncbi:hypothetical protein [Tunicatimonas pelagia]|nr:hypothetical protein [Tunicatimonas pelagia]WKN46515.1 hypothetical protein P0M28_30945 [Tunicatimonas pelagia]
MQIIIILSSIVVLASILAPIAKFVFNGDSSTSIDIPIPHQYPIEDSETD